MALGLRKFIQPRKPPDVSSGIFQVVWFGGPSFMWVSLLFFVGFVYCLAGF